MSAAGAQKSQRKSLFIGRRVPLVQHGSPLLYPRYTKLSEVLADAGTQSKATESTKWDVQPQAAVQAVSNVGRAQSALLQRFGTVAAPAVAAAKGALQPCTPGQPSPADDEKKRKRDNPKKKKSTEGVEPAKQPEKTKKKKKQKLVPADGSKQTSGSGNAEQAAELRTRLGVALPPAQPATPAPVPVPFSFGFGFQPSAALASPPAPAALFQAATPAAVESSSSEDEFDEDSDAVLPTPTAAAIAAGGGSESSSSEEESSDSSQESSSEEEGEDNSIPNRPETSQRPPSSIAAPLPTPQKAATPVAKNGGSAPPEPGQSYVPRRVFVGGMPFTYEETSIREYWSDCGEIESLDIMRFPDSGRFKGMVFITFTTEEAYNNALTCDGSSLDGQYLRVDRCKAKRGVGAVATPSKEPKAPEPSKVDGYWVAYVGNISFEVSSEQLEGVFADVGVEKVRLHTDKASGQSKGYAHVHFKNEESLEQAIGMTGHNLEGRNLKISYAQKKK